MLLNFYRTELRLTELRLRRALEDLSSALARRLVQPARQRECRVTRRNPDMHAVMMREMTATDVKRGDALRYAVPILYQCCSLTRRSSAWQQL